MKNRKSETLSQPKEARRHENIMSCGVLHGILGEKKSFSENVAQASEVCRVAHPRCRRCSSHVVAVPCNVRFQQSGKLGRRKQEPSVLLSTVLYKSKTILKFKNF